MLILLDIDGVMVPANSWRPPKFMADGFPEFSMPAVKALQRILLQTNASILLTTSHKTNYALEKWQQIFEARGINSVEIYKLGTDSLNMSRKQEILEWYQNKRVLNEQFVIIDDDKMLNDLPGNVKAHLVLSTPSIGLTEELADKAIAILRIC